MKVYEIKLKVYLLANITSEKATQAICQLIDKSFTNTDEMKSFHEKRQFKFYCFNSFYPLEEKKVYLEGKIYTVVIRTIDPKLAEHFKTYLTNTYTDKLKALTAEVKIIPKKHIQKLYSITSCIARFDGSYWRNKVSIDEYEKRFKLNLMKKYAEFTGKNLGEDIELFTHFSFQNQKPIAMQMKNVKLLGDKISLEIAENDTAQKLAYMALGTGFSELNSRGAGFVNYKYL